MAQTYYPQDSNTDTTCDYGSSAYADHDMSKTTGTSTTHDVTDASGSFTVQRTYAIDVSGDGITTGSQSYDVSLSINSLNKSNVRVRLAAVDTSGCARTYSGYSTTWTSSGVQTDTLTLNFAATDEMLELQVEVQNTGKGNSCIIDVQDANTFVTAPTGGAGGAQAPAVL